MLFKEVVKKMIKENGMTQAELSEKLGFETQGGFAATLGSQGCVMLYMDEPKMPKSLIER